MWLVGTRPTVGRLFVSVLLVIARTVVCRALTLVVVAPAVAVAVVSWPVEALLSTAVLAVERLSESLWAEGSLIVALLIAVVTVVAVIALWAWAAVANTRARRASCGPVIILVAVAASGGLLLVELIFVFVFEFHGVFCFWDYCGLWGY